MSTIVREEEMPLRSSEDIVLARQKVREWAVRLGFNVVEQTKVITAASELARNTYEYGGGGVMRLEHLDRDERNGLRLVFEDKGPGIPDIVQAMTDGWTSGGGMGLGLSGAKRLSDEFDIRSAPGEGTCVRITRWK